MRELGRDVAAAEDDEPIAAGRRSRMIVSEVWNGTPDSVTSAGHDGPGPAREHDVVGGERSARSPSWQASAGRRTRRAPSNSVTLGGPSAGTPARRPRWRRCGRRSGPGCRASRAARRRGDSPGAPPGRRCRRCRRGRRTSWSGCSPTLRQVPPNVPSSTIAMPPVVEGGRHQRVPGAGADDDEVEVRACGSGPYCPRYGPAPSPPRHGRGHQVAEEQVSSSTATQAAARRTTRQTLRAVALQEGLTLRVGDHVDDLRQVDHAPAGRRRRAGCRGTGRRARSRRGPAGVIAATQLVEQIGEPGRRRAGTAPAAARPAVVGRR